MAEAGRGALFVDRDGTVIREREYLSHPGGVELLPGAVPGLTAFRRAGYPIVVVTNQSGIARGYYDEAAYAAVHRELVDQLGVHGIEVLAAYHCPHHPDVDGPCDCRKPAPGLFERAAREHGLDLAASVLVGDRLRDVEPARRWRARAVLVRTGYGREEAAAAPADVAVAEDLADAARLVLGPGAGAVDRPDPRG